MNEIKEILENFQNIVENKNLELLSKEYSIISKEKLSILVSECLVEDITTIISLKNGQFNSRYIDMIIRNMSEQVIEYCYIMKNPDILNEYFGENINTEIEEDANLLSKLKETGSARFNDGKRKNVYAMAKEIDEVKSTEDRIALYEIFGLKAEMEHNSYFQQIINIVGEIENEELQNNSIDSILIDNIIYVFLKYYNSLDNK